MNITRREKTEEEKAEEKAKADYFANFGGNKIRPEGKELARRIHETIYTDAMLVIDRIGGERNPLETPCRNAIKCFFDFAIEYFETRIMDVFDKDKPFPVIQPSEKDFAENMKSFLAYEKSVLTEEGYEKLVALTCDDYLLFSELIKKLVPPNAIFHSNLLITGYRFYLGIMQGAINREYAKPKPVPWYISFDKMVSKFLSNVKVWLRGWYIRIFYKD
jgi:hypothetical protein